VQIYAFILNGTNNTPQKTARQQEPEAPADWWGGSA